MLVGPGTKLEAPLWCLCVLFSFIPLPSHPTLPGVATGKVLMCILLSINTFRKDIVGVCTSFYFKKSVIGVYAIHFTVSVFMHRV